MTISRPDKKWEFGRTDPHNVMYTTTRIPVKTFLADQTPGRPLQGLQQTRRLSIGSATAHEELVFYWVGTNRLKAGAHQQESLSPPISWVNSFSSSFFLRTALRGGFARTQLKDPIKIECIVLISHASMGECDVKQYTLSSSVLIVSLIWVIAPRSLPREPFYK